jgi:four helix bundle protein
MATYTRFEDMEVWQKARLLTREIYAVSNMPPFNRDWRLRDQTRDASISIMSNIAEGFERNGSREFLQHLSIAKGSSGEVRSQLYVALDQRYLSPDAFKPIYSLSCEISHSLGGFMQYLRRSPLRGSKYL